MGKQLLYSLLINWLEITPTRVENYLSQLSNPFQLYLIRINVICRSLLKGKLYKMWP